MSTEVDQEILEEFIVETGEALDTLDERFVALEKNPTNRETIDAIFRPIHSIKGSCAFFGLSNVKIISHKMENILDDIRNNRLVTSTEIIDLLLQGVDILKQMLERIHDGGEKEELTKEEQDYLDDLLKIMAVQEEAESEQGYERYFKEIYESLADLKKKKKGREAIISRLIQGVDKLYSRLSVSDGEKSGREEGKENQKEACIWEGVEANKHVTVFKDFIDQIGASEPDEQRKISFRQHLDEMIVLVAQCQEIVQVISVSALKDCLEDASSAEKGFDSEMKQSMQNCLDKILELVPLEKTKIGEILVKDQIVTDKDIEEALEKQDKGDKRKVGQVLKEDVGVSEAVKAVQTGKSNVKKTMRIEEDMIDSFMDNVGELIISSEVFNYIQKKLEHTRKFPEISKEFKNANMAFNELSNRLQTSLMDVRKVTIKSLFQKIPRMVRDISATLDKEISLQLTGEDSKIDKSLMENLDSPLVHMVRNSVDHGIESCEKREKAGKPKQGTIRIDASCDEYYFYLTISDDGKGLDPELIKESALKKGVIDQRKSETLTDKETLNLIFLPGFSTAKVVTDVSGRGVGMDVVMQNIKKINGVVTVDSELGKGTTVSIKLPLKLTLIVVDGLVIEVGKNHFIIPLKFIKESIRPKQEELITVEGKGEMVNIRGKLFPMIRLHELFSITPMTTNPTEALVVAVEVDGKTSCILVDQIVSQQQVVLKDLGDKFKSVKPISGGAIMGDGRVGLVLNIEGVMEAAFN